MVQPTPHLLLRPAVSLATSFSLLAHPKVPLTPNESRQLLKLLTASFRQQLDKEHGNSIPNCSPSITAASSSSARKASEKSLQSRPNATPTDRHLHDILNNPLLLFQPPPKRTGPKDPMDVFEQACASGFMTVSRARACLHAKKDSLGMLAEETQTRIKSSDAGSKVFKWLLSTGAASDSSWLRPVGPGAQRIKHDIIFEFLVLEGKQEVLWDLFEHYVSLKLPNINILLYQLSKSLAQSISIGAGYESVVRASEILNRSEIAPEGRMSILHNSVSHLVNATKRIMSGNTQPSPALYDRFLGIVQTIAVPPRILKAALYMPHLHLCHPSSPDTGPALRYLKDLEKAPSESLSTATPSFSRSVIWLALETTTQLLEREQYDDARWVLSFVQKTYPEQIGTGLMNPEHKVTPKQTEADATSLEMLNNLELGLAGA